MTAVSEAMYLREFAGFDNRALLKLWAEDTPRAIFKHPKLKKVQKTLGYLETNPRHPGLETHEFSSLSGPRGRRCSRRMSRIELLAPGGSSGTMVRNPG